MRVMRYVEKYSATPFARVKLSRRIEIVFQAADRLAHRRLGSTEFDGGPREAVFGRDCDEGFEFSELHRPSKSKRAITLIG